MRQGYNDDDVIYVSYGNGVCSVASGIGGFYAEHMRGARIACRCYHKWDWTGRSV